MLELAEDICVLFQIAENRDALAKFIMFYDDSNDIEKIIVKAEISLLPEESKEQDSEYSLFDLQLKIAITSDRERKQSKDSHQK